MNRGVVASILIAFAALACSKTDPKQQNANAAAGPGKPSAAEGAKKPEAPKPPPKPQGPLQSDSGTRMARLEVNPSGRFFVVVLAKNRIDPEVVDAKELECTLMREGKVESTKLVPKPLDTEKDGKCSRYTGFSNLLIDGKPLEVLVRFPDGEKKVASFKVPENYRSF